MNVPNNQQRRQETGAEHIRMWFEILSWNNHVTPGFIGAIILVVAFTISISMLVIHLYSL